MVRYNNNIIPQLDHQCAPDLEFFRGIGYIAFYSVYQPPNISNTTILYIIYSKCAIKSNAKYSMTVSILHIQSQSIHPYIVSYLVHSLCYTLATEYPIIR